MNNLSNECNDAEADSLKITSFSQYYFPPNGHLPLIFDRVEGASPLERFLLQIHSTDR